MASASLKSEPVVDIPTATIIITGLTVVGSFIRGIWSRKRQSGSGTEPGIPNGRRLSLSESVTLLLTRSEDHGERLTKIEEKSLPEIQRSLREILRWLEEQP